MRDHQENPERTLETSAYAGDFESAKSGLFSERHCRTYETDQEDNLPNSKETLSVPYAGAPSTGGLAAGDLVKFVSRFGDKFHETYPDVYEVKDSNVYGLIALKGIGGSWLHERFVKHVRTTDNAVEHPPHYNSDPSGIECIQVTEHRNFCVGNAIKYLWRAGLKGNGDAKKHIEDLRKSVWYIQREIERLEKLV